MTSYEETCFFCCLPLKVLNRRARIPVWRIVECVMLLVRAVRAGIQPYLTCTFNTFRWCIWRWFDIPSCCYLLCIRSHQKTFPPLLSSRFSMSEGKKIEIADDIDFSEGFICRPKHLFEALTSEKYVSTYTMRYLPCA